MCQKWLKNEIDTVAFRLEMCLQLIRLHSEPSSIQGWRVELSTKEVYMLVLIWSIGMSTLHCSACDLCVGQLL